MDIFTLEYNAVDIILISGIGISLVVMIMTHLNFANYQKTNKVTEDPADWTIEVFERLPVTWPLFISLSLAIIYSFYHLTPFDSKWYADISSIIEDDFNKNLFAIYLLYYACLWFSYFISKTNMIFLRSRTLRTMLQMTREIAEKRDYEVKAQSNITLLTLLVATSVVVLSIANDIYLELGVRGGRSLDRWQEFVLALSAVFSVISSFFFILSSDMLDTIMNRFENEDKPGEGEDFVIKQRLYSLSANPVYFGKILLMASIALLVSVHYPLIGWLSIILLILFGYEHWFPYRIAGETKGGKTKARVRPYFELVILIAWLLTPIGLVFFQ